jgi:predicted  nucleic acid-binding Zn-ribbon protein
MRMTDESAGTLKGLQDLDLLLEKVRARTEEFGPLLADLEQPALSLEQEVATLRSRLQDMKLEERRLEHAADGRRSRAKLLQERLKSVRNLREEAAVHAEQDLVRQALEGEEQEALTLLDQIRKMEARLEELHAASQAARAEVEPRRVELLREREAVETELVLLEERRKVYAARIPRPELRNYERIRAGHRSVVVASLTADGACGHCFSMVPIQVQNEIRKGAALIPCEACGVLLGPGEDAP